MPREAIDDLVDHLALGPERHADEIELVCAHRSDRRAVRLVVRRLEELFREDRELLDAALHRSLIRPAQGRRVGLEHQHRLPEHRQVSVPGAVDVGLADDAGLGPGNAADEERRHVRPLPVCEVIAQDNDQLRVK